MNKASAKPPQTNPRMSTIVRTVEVVIGVFSLEQYLGARLERRPYAGKHVLSGDIHEDAGQVDHRPVVRVHGLEWCDRGHGRTHILYRHGKIELPRRRRE